MQNEPLRTLEEKVNPKHSALICVDMQNEFCEATGGSASEGSDISMIREMAPRLTSFIGAARALSLPVIFIRSVYDTEDGRYLSDAWIERRTSHKGPKSEYIPFCVEGSWGWEFVKGVKPRNDELVVTKHRYSAFFDTELDLVLRSRGIRTIIVTGVTTNCCVDSTTRDGFMKDYYVVLVSDCVAAFSQRAHAAALENLGRLFGQVASSAEVLKAAGRAAGTGEPLRTRSSTG